MDHPRLGPLTRSEHHWEGAALLPSFAGRGAALRDPDDPQTGIVRVRIDSSDGSIAAEQEEAVRHLLDDEPAVFAAVWGELTPVLSNFDPVTEIICTEVEVSSLHVRGVAYLGFSIEVAGHLEHGFQVVYHPSKGTWWGDWEALNAIEEADNLPPRPEE